LKLFDFILAHHHAAASANEAIMVVGKSLPFSNFWGYTRTMT